MGAPFIDWLIADDYVIPPGQESGYSERIARMKHCWQSNDRLRPTLAPLTRSEYGLPDQGFVFCCFAQAAKITPDVYARWMSLLQHRSRQRPVARRGQRAGNAKSTRGRRRAWRRLRTHRVRAARSRSRSTWRAIAWPTSRWTPFPIPHTPREAMRCGAAVPLVALTGETFAARVSGSILTHAGLPDLITESLDDYEQLARTLATEPSLSRRPLRGSRRPRKSALRCGIDDPRSGARYLDLVHGSGHGR